MPETVNPSQITINVQVILSSSDVKLLAVTALQQKDERCFDV